MTICCASDPAVGAVDELVGAMNAHGPGAAVKGNVVLGIEFQGPEREALGVRFAFQPGLGERRPLVRGNGFVSDENDWPLVSVLPQ